MTETTNPAAPLRFIVIGRAGMDLYPEPAGIKTAQATRFSAMLGGSAGNIAAGLARLGTEVSLMTALSDDPVGRFCTSQLSAFGIDQSLVCTSGRETRTSLALSETRWDDHETVIYRNGAADFDLAEDLPERMTLDGLTALVVTGTALAREPSRGVTSRSIARAREAGVPVVIDLDYRPYSWGSVVEAGEVYRAAALQSSIVIGNDVEFAVLRGAAFPSPDHARRLCADWPDTCVYKMGKDGSSRATAPSSFVSSPKHGPDSWKSTHSSFCPASFPTGSRTPSSSSMFRRPSPSSTHLEP